MLELEIKKNKKNKGGAGYLCSKTTTRESTGHAHDEPTYTAAVLPWGVTSVQEGDFLCNYRQLTVTSKWLEDHYSSRIIWAFNILQVM